MFCGLHIEALDKPHTAYRRYNKVQGEASLLRPVLDSGEGGGGGSVLSYQSKNKAKLILVRASWN